MRLARSGVCMNVNIDQPRSDIETAGVDYLKRLRPIDASGYQGDLAIANRYIPHGVDLVFRIDHMTALKQ
jgi:hypothetical protein